MVATTFESVTTFQAHGRPFQPPRGRYVSRQQLKDSLQPAPFVIPGRPLPEEFVAKIVREMRLRFYQPKTIKSYRSALTAFLRWFGNMPHHVTREDVRSYLETLVDGGASFSWASVNLDAIRTGFDNMCGRDVTLGLQTPRRAKRLPVALSVAEVQLLLSAALSLRDKLLLGLMYATGMRVSEVCRLRWGDIDFERRLVTAWQGKRRSDRRVTLPVSFASLLNELGDDFGKRDYLFPGEHRGRHVSIRAVQHIVERTVSIAGIGKRITPHSFRQTFATHLLEKDTDIRCLQELLEQINFETTTIYTKVAAPNRPSVADPSVAGPSARVLGQATASVAALSKPVGRMRLELSPRDDRDELAADATIIIESEPRPVRLAGIVVRESRPGWIALDLPPLEAWQPQLRWLRPEQRQRIESPAFYDCLRQRLGDRFLTLPSKAAGIG